MKSQDRKMIITLYRDLEHYRRHYRTGFLTSLFVIALMPLSEPVAWLFLVVVLVLSALFGQFANETEERISQLGGYNEKP